MEKLLTTNLVKKYRFQILGIVALFVSAAVVAGLVIKPRYKVASVISISPSYFQNSLMREFLSEVYDPNELRSQRLSVMSAALDKKFLDEMATGEGVDISKETTDEAAKRRMKILSAVEIIPTQATDFQISVIGNDREKAMNLNQKVIDNILIILKEKRMGMLTNLRSAIAAQIESMTPNSDVPATHDAQVVRVASLESQIKEMQQKFSDQHPQVVALKKQLAESKKLAAQSAATDDSLVNYNNIKTIDAKPGQYNTVYEDLVRKLRYLNIVIAAESMPVPNYFSVVRSPEYPLSAIWPKKGLFVIWALLLGILTSLVFVAMKEVGAQNVLGKIAGKAKSLRDIDFIEETTEKTEKQNLTDKDQMKDDARL